MRILRGLYVIFLRFDWFFERRMLDRFYGSMIWYIA